MVETDTHARQLENQKIKNCIRLWEIPQGRIQEFIMGGARLGPGWPSKSWADPGFQVSGGGGGGGAMGSGIWIL